MINFKQYSVSRQIKAVQKLAYTTVPLVLQTAEMSVSE